MKIRYNAPRKSIFILVVGIVISWTVAGNALEQWDAKASVRVNLRKAPGLNGEILSIIPNGHKVRIMEKKGLWCKVVVEGEISGKGWVYAKYLERIVPTALKSESSTQAVRVEIASGAQKQGTCPVDPPPRSRTEVEVVKPLWTPLSEITLTTNAKVQSSAQKELQDTKNESNVPSQLEILMAVEPVHMPPVQPPYSGFKQDAAEISRKYSSELIEQGESTTYQKRIPGEKKKHDGAAQGTVPTVSEQPVPEAHGMASSVIRSAVSHETKGLIFKRRSIGPVEIALKLLSILLYCLIVLLLYKGN
jgi:uncharacterized protein YraI